MDETLLAALRENTDDESRWLALSRWLWDNGRADGAAAGRVFWPSLRDNVAELGQDETLAALARDAATLGRQARRVEERGAVVGSVVTALVRAMLRRPDAQAADCEDRP
jgi:hypothetical protein